MQAGQVPKNPSSKEGKAPGSLQGRLCKKTLRGWEVGALPHSTQTAGSWEPSAGFLAPTSLAIPSALPTLSHCPFSGLVTF